jgi:peptide/nickel transport system permease protein
MGRSVIGYVLRRLGYAVLVVWVAYTATFLLLFALPSDPVAIMMASAGGETASASDPAAEAALREQLGLDRPLPLQYLHALAGVATGDLGTSATTGRPVLEEITDALPSTIALGLAGLVAALVVGGLLTALLTAVHAPWLQRLTAAVPTLITSFPVFWIALLLLQLFAFRLGWFPPFGDRGAASLVLPAITLGIPTGALYAHVLGGSIRKVSLRPYVGTALDKGLSLGEVLRRHVLRNAVIPVFTIFALSVGDILAGAVVTETIFNRPGVGKVLQQAVDQQNFPVVQGLVLFFAVSFALVNLAADLVYPLIDPQITGVIRPRRPSTAVPSTGAQEARA